MHGQKNIKLYSLFLCVFAKLQITLNEYLSIFMIISRSSPHVIRNVSDKHCREKQNTHYIFDNFFFENRAVCEIMWENIVEPARL